MEKFVAAILILVGLINFYPAVGIISAEVLSSLYKIDIPSNDIHILLRHRAVLFGRRVASRSWRADHAWRSPAAFRGCMMLAGDRWLKLGGVLSFAVALLHIVIIFVGAPAYRYFGAGEEMARAAESGSSVPAVMTLVLVVIFAVWGVYAFSGARMLRRLPLLRTALLMIGAIYTLRGLAVLGQVVQIITSAKQVEPREVMFSLVSLGIGLAYLLGTIISWSSLRANSRPVET